jgi:hypothetical protein
MTRSVRRRPRRALVGLAALVVLAVPATTLTAAGPGAASPGEVAARPKAGHDQTWAGYKIRSDGTAGGGWLGGRKLDGGVVYRIDPTRRPVSTGYGAATTTERAGGRASRKETARAAYVLSTYGTYRYAVQAAAVDIAVNSLLVGGPYALTGPKTAQRLRQTPQPAKVLTFARKMLKDAARKAGAPRLTVTATNTAVGGSVQATAELRDTRGQAMAEQKVWFDYPGATTQTVETDKSGNATVTFPATAAGQQPVTASVPEVPEWRLVVQDPAKKKASRLARAGAKTVLTATAAGTVTVRPTIQITTPTQGMRTSAVPGRFVISGGQPGSRTAGVRLWGPFSSAAATTCSGKIAVAKDLTVTGNGTYNVPALVAPSAGFYVWQVVVPGDAVNQAASACGTPIVLQVQPAVTITRSDTSYPAGSAVPSTVNVSGLPTNQTYSNSATVDFYGPYADRENIACGATRLERRTSVRITANGSLRAPDVTLSRTGFYGLVVTLPARTFSTAAASACNAGGSVIRVE